MLELDLQQPRLELGIQEEVEAKELEAAHRVGSHILFAAQDARTDHLATAFFDLEVDPLEV